MDVHIRWDGVKKMLSRLCNQVENFETNIICISVESSKCQLPLTSYQYQTEPFSIKKHTILFTVWVNEETEAEDSKHLFRFRSVWYLIEHIWEIQII